MPEHALSSNRPQTALPAAQSVAVDPAAIKQDDSEGLIQRLPLQRKLAVGATDDPMEREADNSIADKVMRMPETSFIQRKCGHCAEEETVQRKPLASFIQKKGEEAAAGASDAVSSRKGTGISMKVQRAPLRPPLRPACPVRPDDFIRLVVVNQETPQSVSIFWNSSGKVETGECSTGKGPCCVPDGAPDNAVGATEAQSKINGSNSTEIGTFTVTQVRESNGGINFWTQFLDGRSEALHEYTPVDGTPLSHGCVRLHTEMAKKIHCGAIANVTRVEVRGFARPRCSHPELITEWLKDFRDASPRDDGDKNTVEVRHELIDHFNLGKGEAGQKALDDKIGSLKMPAPNQQFIDPVKGAEAIPRCTGVSGLGKEVERLQRTRPDQHNDAAATAFRNSLGLATSVAAATTAARQSGTDLWKNAHSLAASVDDRPLYWTRNFIIRELQEWHPLFSVSPAQRAGIIKTFEMASRGLDVTAFAPVEAGTKRILITGFDPFGMDDSFGRPGAMSGMSVGNPSGAIVLALDGQTISGPRCSALIQGVVFPVRYRDFDEGVVEQYVRHFTGGANPVDMIMTISRNRDDGIFELERFAGRARSGFPDNEGASSNQAALDRSLARIHGPHARTDEFTQSTLPRANMSAPPKVVMDDSYSGHLPDGTAVDQTTSPVPGANVRSDNGSGGNYLSNEIFYRVSLLQLNQHTSIPMGHLHVPGGTQAEYPAIISTVQQILARALNSTICPPEYNDAPDMPAFRNYT